MENADQGCKRQARLVDRLFPIRKDKPRQVEAYRGLINERRLRKSRIQDTGSCGRKKLRGIQTIMWKMNFLELHGHRDGVWVFIDVGIFA